MVLSTEEKDRILTYLKSFDIYAGAPCYVMDHKTHKPIIGKTLYAYYNGAMGWTNEEIYNFEQYDEIFDEELFKYILTKSE